MLDDVNVQKAIRVELLVNAKLFNGKPNTKAVMGKLLGKNKNLRSYAKELGVVINDMAKEIEAMSMDEINTELNNIAPDAISEVKKTKAIKSKKRREQKKELEEIPNAVKGKFVVRYAPDPSKYPHIGQGMNFLINRLYADKYEGKVVLRFDDTNPTIVRAKYFDAIKDGLLWLGCTWDEEVRASEFLQEFYEIAKDWILKKYFYVCLCEGENLSKGREDGVACVHRSHSVEENQRLFDKMLANEYKTGQATVRLIGDMTSTNNVMRDPVMYRIVKDKHEMLDKFYPVFPTYDFESSYLDWKMGITHIIRSGEFGTMRQELQSFIITKLGGVPPFFKSFGRFNIQGCPTKGRVIRELVETGVVTGWDDIRLITLAGLKNRGVHPHTPRLLIQEAGLTPKSSTIAWSTFEKKSRELLEADAKRLFFVEDPVKILVNNLPIKSIDLDFHPLHEEFGKRHLVIGDGIYIASADFKKLNLGDTFRLKDLCNVTITELGEEIIADFAGNEIVSKMPKIQWVSNGAIEGSLMVPDMLEKEKNKINTNSLSTISGLFESTVSEVQNEVIQFERVGFAKIYIEENKVKGHIVHKI